MRFTRLAALSAASALVLHSTCSLKPALSWNINALVRKRPPPPSHLGFARSSPPVMSSNSTPTNFFP